MTSQNERWASMSGSGGTIDFWTVPNHRPAAWPDGTPTKQLHLDFYADPAGHPFCLSTWGNPE